MQCRTCLNVLAVLAALGQTIPSEARQPPYSPKTWEKLVAKYRAYGLPLPGSETKLVLYTKRPGTVNGVPVVYKYLGFLLKPAVEEKKAILLLGTTEMAVPQEELEIVEPKPQIAADLNGPDIFLEPYPMNHRLGTAIQCRIKGWDSLADQLLDRCVEDAVGDGIFTQPPHPSPKEALSHLVLTHLSNEVLKPKSDRARIAKQMRTLFAEDPDLATRERKAFLSSLEAAAVPSHAKPGSIEAMIADLAEVSESRNYRGDEPYQKRIAGLGFAAVPSLLDHLDDRRLTRAVQPGVMNSPPRNLLVQDIVGGLLEDIAGEKAAKQWRHRAPVDDRLSWPLEKQDVLAWWRSIKNVDEEAYLADHVLSDSRAEPRLNSSNLQLLAKKYPHRLEKIYRIILDERPQAGLWEIAEAVAESSLPKEKKIELLMLGATHKNPEHRIAGLNYLSELDHKQFVVLLIKALNGLPGTSALPYWRCPEARLARLVMATDDPNAWDARERLAKRSVVGLRMEQLDDTHSDSKQHRAQRLKFLAAFLNDGTVRDADSDAKISEGPYAGWGFSKMEVRNFAALQIASITGLEVEPEFGKDLKPEAWEMVRKLVLVALEHEGIEIPEHSKPAKK